MSFLYYYNNYVVYTAETEIFYEKSFCQYLPDLCLKVGRLHSSTSAY